MADRVIQKKKPSDQKQWHLAQAMMNFFSQEPSSFLSEWRGMSYQDKVDWREMFIREGYNVLPIPDEQKPAIDGSCTRIADSKSLPAPYTGPLLLIMESSNGWKKDKAGPNYQNDDEPEEPRIIVDTGLFHAGDDHPAAAAV